MEIMEVFVKVAGPYIGWDDFPQKHTYYILL